MVNKKNLIKFCENRISDSVKGRIKTNNELNKEFFNGRIEAYMDILRRIEMGLL